MERNLKLVIAFDGTDFHGWQRQLAVRTVQEEIENVARRVVREPVNLIASGRTDAGVHAVGMVANFRTACDLPCERLRRAIGTRLPEDIGLVDVAEVALEFHATHSAVSKHYRYRIHNAKTRPVVSLTQRYCYHFWGPLDVQAMRDASRHMVGTLDFSALTTVQCQRESMVRTVLRCDVQRIGDEVHVDVEGNGFLQYQVRNMAGTLIEVGRSHWPADRVPAIIESKDRSQAGPTAPSLGLCLMGVTYPEKLLIPPEPTTVDVPNSNRSPNPSTCDVHMGDNVSDSISRTRVPQSGTPAN